MEFTINATGNTLTDPNLLSYVIDFEENSGAFQITVTEANTYTYTSNGSTPDGAYSGTITATGATIYGTTDANGDISSSRTYTLSQPVKGYARKASTAPFYKQIEINDTVNNSTGLTVNRRLVLDQ